MKLSQIGTVFAKEALDNLRDRRTVITALLSTLIGPALILVLYTVLGQVSSDRAEQPLSLPVVGSENAPSLVSFLRQNDVKILPGPADPEAEVRAGNLDVVLVIPAGFGEVFAGSQPATVRLVVDESRQSATPAVRRARSLLESYGRQVASLRLVARGVSPSVIQVLAVENVDVSTPQSMGAMVLYLVPFFLIFSVFGGGMYLAIDATAGERERGSLEPLLINPVGRAELVLGKLGAIIVFSLVAVAGTLLGFFVMLRALPLEKLMGVSLILNPSSLLATFLIAVPMSLLASALQMVIGSYTRSFKEAQSYLGFLPLIPGLPGMVIGLIPFKVELWTMLIPTFGQQLLINQIVRGEDVNPLYVAVSALVTIAAGVGLTVFTIRLYRREGILALR